MLNGIVLPCTNNILKNPIVDAPIGTSMTIQTMNLTEMSLLGNDPTGQKMVQEITLELDQIGRTRDINHLILLFVEWISDLYSIISTVFKRLGNIILSTHNGQR